MRVYGFIILVGMFGSMIAHADYTPSYIWQRVFDDGIVETRGPKLVEDGYGYPLEKLGHRRSSGYKMYCEQFGFDSHLGLLDQNIYHPNQVAISSRTGGL